MGLVNEIKTFVFEVFYEEPIMHFKSFEDKSRAIDISRLLEIHPRTKHINVVFHHFRDYVRKGLINI